MTLPARAPLLATTLVATVLAMPALAAVPSPSQSTVDPVLLGTASGNAIQAASSAQPGFRVIVRDIIGQPIGNAQAMLDFFDAVGPRGISVQESGTTVNCAAKLLTRLTDAAGVAIFAARFGGYDNQARVLVIADGVVLAQVPARSTDVAADDGITGLSDFALFTQAFLPCPACPPCATCPELDFDASGGIALNDFAILAREFMLDVPPATYCW